VARLPGARAFRVGVGANEVVRRLQGQAHGRFQARATKILLRLRGRLAPILRGPSALLARFADAELSNHPPKRYWTTQHKRLAFGADGQPTSVPANRNQPIGNNHSRTRVRNRRYRQEASSRRVVRQGQRQPPVQG